MDIVCLHLEYCKLISNSAFGSTISVAQLSHPFANELTRSNVNLLHLHSLHPLVFVLLSLFQHNLDSNYVGLNT